MSWVPVAEYFIGLGIFGFFYWLFDGILHEIVSWASEGIAYDLIWLVWRGLPLIVVLFGGIWLLMRMQKREYGVLP